MVQLGFNFILQYVGSFFWTKKTWDHTECCWMNIFVRSSKGQSRYPLISTVLLQKRIFSSYFEGGSWNTLPIGLGVCGPRWRIGSFEEKVFRPPPDLPSKTLPSMLSYFFFLYYRHPQAHGWKVCSSDIPTKIWWFHSHFGNFTYKQSHLFFHHLILRMWLTDRSGLEISPPSISTLHPWSSMYGISQYMYWYLQLPRKAQPKWKVKSIFGELPHLSHDSSHHEIISPYMFRLGDPVIHKSSFGFLES